MGRTHILSNHLAEHHVPHLHERKANSEKRKRELIHYLERLKQAYREGRITYARYVEIIHHKKDGRTIEEWIHYYHFESLECHRRIQEVRNQRKRKFIILGSLILAIFLIYFIANNFTQVGFVSQDENASQEITTRVLSQSLDLKYSENATYEFTPEIQGKLKSLKLSGSIEGKGQIKIYLGDLLILDSDKIKETKTRSLTALAVDETESEQISNSDGLNDGGSAQGTSPSLDSSQEESVEPSSSGTIDETIIPEETSTESELIINESNSDNLNDGGSSNETSPFQEEPLSSEIKIKPFSEICEETCNLGNLNLTQESYSLRIEIISSEAKLNLHKINYEIETIESASVPGETTNQTETITTPETNATVTTIQHQAVIGKPVKWTKEIKLDNAGQVKVNIPKESENVTVYKINKRQASGTRDSASFSTEEKQREKISLTGMAVSNSEESGILNFFKRIFSGMTGRAVSDTTEITINENASEYEVEYYTEAPQAIEEATAEGKTIIVSGPDELHYTDILAYTELPREMPLSGIKLYHLENGSLVEIAFTAYDNNENGLIDHIEWNVPHLSEQRYVLVIKITSAAHLDGNKTFIEDVYNETYKQDGIWKTIPSGHYVRISFERNLTSAQDITLYVRNNNSDASVEVYEKDSDVLVASFPIISSAQNYQIFLDNLVSESQDTFDLKITGSNSSVEFDYIVDPAGLKLPWWTESGEVTLGAATTTPVDLTQAVNTSKAFILFSRRAPAAQDEASDSGAFVQWVNSTRFNLIKSSTESNATYVWQVIEGNNLSVQNGTQSYTTGQVSFNIPINSVNVSRSVAFMSFGSCNSTTVADNNEIFWIGNITNSTNLNITRLDGGACAGSVSYFVVEFNDGSVIQTGEISSVGAIATPSYANVNTINMSNTWLYFSMTFDATALGLDDTGVIGRHYNTTAFQFLRSFAGGTASVRWYAITTPNASVQYGTQYYSASTGGDVPISAITLNKSFSLSSFNNSGTGSTWANALFTSRITNATNLALTKSVASNDANVAWQVVQFSTAYTDNPPSVSLSSPSTSYYNDSSQYVNLTFNASVTDDFALINCSLWHNYTGTWHLNQTQTITGTSNVTNFTLTNMSNKTFIWNIGCYDDMNQLSFGTANRSVVLNWTALTGITFDSNSSGTGTGNLTFSHTIGNYENRVLIVGATGEGNAAALANSSCRAVNVTFGGVVLTKLIGYDFDDTGADDCSSLWYLLNATVGTANIVVTYAGTVQMTEANAGGISVYNVAQQAPTSTNYSYCTGCTSINTSIFASINNSWIFDSVASGNLGGYTTTQTNQTERWDRGSTTAQGAGSTREVNPSGTYSVGWNQAANRLVHTLAVFAPYSVADTIAPIVNLSYPPVNYYNDSSQYVNLTFNASVSDNIQLKNCSFWTNYSGTWSLNQTQNVIGTSNVTNFTLTNMSNKTFIWNIQCFDTSNNNSFNSTNRTVVLNWTAVNHVPTQTNPILNSTLGTNYTSENLTCYNQSTADSDGNSVKNIFNWIRNGTSIMVLNMPFEGGSNSTFTKDYSGFGNNGAVNSSNWNATGGRDGKGAYIFNGTDNYINLGQPASLNFTGNQNFTISSWVKVFSHNGLHRPILVKGDTQYILKIYTDNKSEACAYDGGWKCIYSINPLDAGSWYHLVARFENGNLSLWQNGVLQSSIAYSGIIANSYNVNIGRDAENPTRLFNGTIDDVKIYNTSLSSQQISALYNNQTNLIVSQELVAGQNWTCSVTPNDGIVDGTTLSSNNLTIRALLTLPSIINILPIAGTQYNISSPINISATITDPQGISYAYVNVTFPNGTLIRYPLANYSANNYSVEFSDLTQKGRYNVSFFANDTLGNVNNTETTWFNRTIPENKIFDIIDNSSGYINSTSAILSDIGGIQTIEINITQPGYNIKKIIIEGYNKNSPYSVIKISNSTGDGTRFSNTFMIDLDNANLTQANITINSSEYHLFKCTDFNKTSLTCNSEDYEQFKTGLIPGQLYTFTLNKTDPIFGETIQGTTNTSDSYFREGAITSNFGGATNIRVGGTTTANTIRGILWFNLSHIPSYANITSANLSLYFYSIPTGDATGNRTHNLHKVQQSPARNWTELNVTWNNYDATNAWTTAGGDYLATPSVNATFDNSTLNSWIVYNVTSDVENLTDNSSLNFGWVIKDSDESTVNIRRDYYSSEYATNTSLIPLLDVSYFIPNFAPTHTNPLLNSSDGSNDTSQNLTCWNQSTADLNGDAVKNIYNWYKSGDSITVLLAPFEGGSNSTYTKDYGGANNILMVNGSTWNSTGGQDGWGAYDFDGVNDYMEIKNDSTMVFDKSNGTMMVWIYLKGLKTGNQNILEDEAEQMEMAFDSTGRLFFYPWVDWGIWNNYIRCNSSIPLNTWTHLAVTWDYPTKSAKIYYNGVLQNISYNGLPTYWTDKAETGDWYVGRKNASATFPDRHLNASLDELKIFNTALSQQTIYNYYSGQSNMIVGDDIISGDNWTCSVTPNDRQVDGTTLYSNSLIVSGDEFPLVSLNYPLNDAYVYNIENTIFNATATDDKNLANCSLWHNATGTWHLNQTQARTGTSNVTNFTLANITNKTIIWNIQCTDNSSQSSFAISNRTLTFTDKPTLSSISLNATSANNLTSDNLTCNYNLNGSSITSTISWTVNSNPIMLLNLPFEGNAQASLLDFSGRGHSYLVNNNAVWNATGGRDGRGAFFFNSSNNSYVHFGNIPDWNLAETNHSISIWFKAGAVQSTYARLIDRFSGGTPGSGYTIFISDTGILAYQERSDGGNYVLAESAGGYNDNQWHMVTSTLNAGTKTAGLYVDGALVDTDIYNGTLINRNYYLYIGGLDGSENFNGSLDEVRIYNRTLSPEQISALYQNKTNVIVSNETNSSEIWQCQATPFSAHVQGDTYSSNNLVILDYVDTINPNVIFNSQSPADLNITNFLGPNGVNITYNITDASGINNNSVKLYYKSNSTTDNIMFYLNGTSYSGYFSDNPIQNGSPTYLWNLDDNQVLPGTYNYGEITMENTLHSSATITSSNDFLGIEFYNISNAKQYTFFEIMANRTSGTGSLRYYYCNSSYVFSNQVSSNQNCVNFYTQTTNTYNHVHSANSAHMLAPMTINTTTGTIGNVKVTPVSYLLIRGNTATTWTFYHISNTSRTGAYKTTANGGSAWTNRTYTVDGHIHQFGSNTSLWYYVCANDTSNNQNCTSTTPRQDWFELAGLPPTSPSVYNPIEGVYSGNISINYTASESPNGYAISYYNISLVNADESFNKTIILNNSVNLSYVWNSVGTINGEYRIRVQACDNLSQCSYGYSENFTIDNLSPIITNPTSSPTLPFTNNGTVQNVSVNFTSNEYPINVTFRLYYPNGTIAVTQGPTQINNASQLPINFSLPAGLADGNYSLNMSIADSLNNTNTTNLGNIIIDSTPVIVIDNSNGTGLNFTSNITANYGDGIYDINLTVYNEDANNIFISRFNSSGCSALIFESDTNETFGDKDFAFSTECMIFANITLSINAAVADHLYKCSNWSMETLLCNDENSWEVTEMLEVGLPYDIILTPGDPGFIELNVSNIDILADGTADESNPAQEYGARVRMDVENYSGTRAYSLIKVNLTKIPAGVIITNATLIVTAVDENLEAGNIMEMGAYRVYQNFSWVEGTGGLAGNACTGNEFCWNYKPNSSQYNATAESRLNATDGDTGKNFSFSVTEMVKQAFENNEQNISIYLVPTGNGANLGTSDDIRFHTKESLTNSSRPRLNISYSYVPQIVYVSPISAINPVEASSTPVTFNITMSDADGVADLNDTSLTANFTRAGETTRENLSCTWLSDINATSANYTCTINMWYFDGAGNWNVSVSGKDNSGANATNSSTYFQYNLLQAIVIAPNNVSFNAVSGGINLTANNDPVAINNTGNANLTSRIAINSTNLLGESDASEYIAVQNISVGIADDCAGTRLANASEKNISGVVLEKGNLSLGGGTAQEQLYYCINEVGLISSQTYSTTQGGNWLIKIVLSIVMVSAAPRKRKERQVIADDLSIPATIFIEEVGGLEALAKYLKENLGLTYHEIAELLNRNDRTIWTAYKKASEKSKEKINVKKSLVYIPLSIFKNRDLTIFEAIVVYLKEKGMKFVEIAELLNRDQRNIWTINSRAVKNNQISN